jgi:hypothetical protein
MTQGLLKGKGEREKKRKINTLCLKEGGVGESHLVYVF